MSLWPCRRCRDGVDAGGGLCTQCRRHEELKSALQTDGNETQRDLRDKWAMFAAAILAKAEEDVTMGEIAQSADQLMAKYKKRFYPGEK